jgi:hypothetical protein
MYCSVQPNPNEISLACRGTGLSSSHMGSSLSVALPDRTRLGRGGRSPVSTGYEPQSSGSFFGHKILAAKIGRPSPAVALIVLEVPTDPPGGQVVRTAASCGDIIGDVSNLGRSAYRIELAALPPFATGFRYQRRVSRSQAASSTRNSICSPPTAAMFTSASSANKLILPPSTSRGHAWPPSPHRPCWSSPSSAGSREAHKWHRRTWRHR